jgi:hypothetical protein
MWTRWSSERPFLEISTAARVARAASSEPLVASRTLLGNTLVPANSSHARIPYAYCKCVEG